LSKILNKLEVKYLSETKEPSANLYRCDINFSSIALSKIIEDMRNCMSTSEKVLLLEKYKEIQHQSLKLNKNFTNKDYIKAKK
jgi:hypothetical protein